MCTIDPYTLMKLNKIRIDQMLSDARRAGRGYCRPAEDAQLDRTLPTRARYITIAVSAVLVAVVCSIIVGNLGLPPAG